MSAAAARQPVVGGQQSDAPQRRGAGAPAGGMAGPVGTDELGRLADDAQTLDRLADRLLERMTGRFAELLCVGEPLVDATEIARLTGRSRSWVYDHAGELGAVRLGSGPRPRLGFAPGRVLALLEANKRPAGRPPVGTASRPRKRRRDGRTPAGAPLLELRPHRS